MTLLYITISMITIFSMYNMHVHIGSGCNSYQGHVNDSGGVLESSRLYTYQVSLKMQYCGHLYSSLLCKWTWVDHRDQFPIYKEERKTTLFPSAIHCIFLSSYLALLCSISSTINSSLLQGERQACFAALYAAQH